METRANYVLIGVFALAGFFGILGFLLWFAQFELDRQFDYYDVRFSSVSGLSRASEVRFSGLPVGQVVSVQLSPEQDGTVRARLEVAGDTPVRTDSIATIESMGVTGVSYVGISSGDPRSPLLRSEGEIPEIEAGRSVLQSLTEDAPKIVEEALVVMKNLGALLNDENQQKVQTILDNLAQSSGDLSQALTEFSGISKTIAGATEDIAGFAKQLNPVVAAVEGTLGNLDTTLDALTSLSGRIETSLDEADAALKSGRVALDAAELFMTGELPAISQDLTATTLFLREQSEMLVTDARAMLGEFASTGTAATARLTEAEGTIKAAEGAIDRLTQTLDSIDAAAVSFDGLITDDGTALVSETRGMIETASSAVSAVGKVAETDLPAIVADIRGATETVNRVAAEADATLQSGRGALDAAQGFITGDLRDVARDLRETMDLLRDRTDGLVSDARGMIGEFSAAGSAATARLTEARDTLQSTRVAIDSLVETLDSIDKAAVSFDGLITDDGTALVSETRGMIETASSAVSSVGKVAETDLPAIVADIRGATETVNRVVAEVGADLTDTTGRIDGRIDGLADAATVTMAQVTETFAKANDTLTAIDAAMTTGERTLDAAERVLGDVEQVLDEDVDAITGDLRRVLQRLDGAIAQVSDDIPSITGDLRDAAETANRAFEELGNMVAESGPSVREFAVSGLPQYTRLARETRNLIANLESLARQIERDPARFFLNRQTPEFRR